MANTVITETIANGSIFANGFYGTGIANGISFRAQTFGLAAGSAQNNFVDNASVFLTGYKAAPATLYFYNYNSPDRVEIYQGSTLVTSTDNAIALTQDDRAWLLSDNTGQFFNDSPDLFLKSFTTTPIGGLTYASYAGKITWTHDPKNGTAYTIKTFKGTGSYDWRWVLQYPIDGFTVGCPPLPPKAPPPPATITITVTDPPSSSASAGYFYFNGVLFKWINSYQAVDSSGNVLTMGVPGGQSPIATAPYQIGVAPAPDNISV